MIFLIFISSNSICQVIHIEKASATQPDMKWFPKDRNLVQVEVNINDNTVVRKLKKKIVAAPRDYTPVNFQTILDSDGSIGMFAQILFLKINKIFLKSKVLIHMSLQKLKDI